jgi:hypothetical protein
VIKIGNRLILLLLLPLYLLAGVNASVDQKQIEEGDSVLLTLSSTYDGTTFPLIDEIGGFEIEQTSSSTSIQFINGKQQYIKKLLLSFSPTTSVTIPSFTIEAKGSKYKTDPIAITVVPSSSAKGQNRDFIYEMSIDKRSAYVGEAINLSLKFKRSKDATLLDVELYEPKFENFWYKKIEDDKSYEQGNYLIHEQKYLLYPQQDGTLTLNPNQIKIAVPKPSRDTFGYIVNMPKYKKLYTNALTLEVKPLPDGVDLVGEFKLAAKVNATSAKSGEAINYKILITGSGNFDDIKKFDIDIPYATIYSDKPVKKESITKGKVSNSYMQTFAIISDKSYTIPPFSLKFFNPNTGKTTQLTTKAVNITITDAKNSATSIIKSDTPSASDLAGAIPASWQDKLIFFVMGVVATIFIYLSISTLAKLLNKRKAKSQPQQNSDRELLKALMPYAHLETVKPHINLLEQNIYFGNKNKIKVKEIRSLLSELKPSE